MEDILFPTDSDYASIGTETGSGILRSYLLGIGFTVWVVIAV